MSGLLPALGGGANSVVQLAAGGLSGVLAMSALIASGVVAAGPPPAAPQTLALVGCPGSGSVVAVAKPGDQLWVTGRSADGAWLRVYVPGPAGNDGWAPATTLNLLADGSAVPVAGCAQVAAATATPGPTAVPATATPTATAAPTATAKPTPTPTAAPTASPTPTPTPNLGPIFISQPTSIATILNTNSLGSTTCTSPGAATIRTAVSDPDGVSAVQLWVRKPGASSYKRPGHDFAKGGSTWTARLSVRDDGLATGTLSYYALAIDSKAAQTKSKVRSLKIARCDTEATIAGGLAYTVLVFTDKARVRWSFIVTDADGLATVNLSYVLRTPAGVSFLTGTTTLTHEGEDVYVGSSAEFDGYPVSYQLNTATYTVTSTDQFGGKTSISKVETFIMHLP